MEHLDVRTEKMFVNRDGSASNRGQLPEILVKCGGFSSHLATLVEDKVDGDPLWGSRFDYKNSTAVVQAHLDFLRSGAQIILTNTYQSSIEGFMQHLQLNREQSIELMRKSVHLTQQAKDQFLKELQASPTSELPIIMASIGPYGAHLHDASEYDGRYADQVSMSDIQNWHRPRIEACLAEGVYGLAVETIPCQMEAEAVVEMLLKDFRGIKFWVSFQCKDERSLAHGESFVDAATAVWQRVKSSNAMDSCMGIGVNCLHPKYVAPLFRSLSQSIADPKHMPPLIVYSNRGETFDQETFEWRGRDNCVPLEAFVPEWLELGARIIGGCCRVYPQDIKNLRRFIDDHLNSNFSLKT